MTTLVLAGLAVVSLAVVLIQCHHATLSRLRWRLASQFIVSCYRVVLSRSLHAEMIFNYKYPIFTVSETFINEALTKTCATRICRAARARFTVVFNVRVVKMTWMEGQYESSKWIIIFFNQNLKNYSAKIRQLLIAYKIDLQFPEFLLVVAFTTFNTTTFMQLVVVRWVRFFSLSGSIREE